ncbi:MAG: 16S rRNA processing protein RimM [Gammaproteobacteria bacterium]|nr:16S rRNA processing protein RimM [Gammaproteobacteria bacterium]NDE57557.1 16S rRNA processing protein RimM [Gammaproteobacteria bacterium]
MVDVVEGRPHAGTVVVRIEGFSNRDEALSLRGSKVMVPRDVFPRAPQGSFYWADLMGLRVETSEGIELGRVAGLMETGANDVLEVKGDRDRLIPFVMDQYVKDVRLDEGLLIVDWDPEF